MFAIDILHGRGIFKYLISIDNIRVIRFSKRLDNLEFADDREFLGFALDGVDDADDGQNEDDDVQEVYGNYEMDEVE